MSAEASKELFTIPEVAALLSLSKRTIEALIAKGLLRSAIAPGTERARRISREMLTEYMVEFNSGNPAYIRPGRRR